MSRKRSIVALSVLALLSSAATIAAQDGTITCDIQVDSPYNGQPVGRSVEVAGKAKLPSNYYLWVLVRPQTYRGTGNEWWPHLPGAVSADDGSWQVQANIGSPEDVKQKVNFDVYVVAFAEDEHRVLHEHNRTAKERNYPPIAMPKAACPPVERWVRKIGHDD